MAKMYIQMGTLPAMPVEEGDNQPVKNMSQIYGMVEIFLENLFKEEVDPEETEEENLKRITRIAKDMLEAFEERGIQTWVEPYAIAEEAMGIGTEAAISSLLMDDAIREKIAIWANWNGEKFPIYPKPLEEVEDYVITNPIVWAESIASTW